MAYETVSYEVDDDGIAVLTLNRPEKLNSFTQRMFDELREVIAGVAFSDDVRFLIITGAGRAFSSGVDLSLLASDKKPSALRFYCRQAHQSFDDLEALEVPVIAAINGVCYGGGVELALNCDIRMASDASTFCLIENQLGTIPASGACNRMIRHVGIGKTKEMIISADPIDSREAHRIGLVNYVFPADDLLDRTRAYCKRLLKNSPQAMGMAKHVINMCVNADMHTGRDIERMAQSVLAHSEDHKEGMAAFFEKREPKFTGR